MEIKEKAQLSVLPRRPRSAKHAPAYSVRTIPLPGGEVAEWLKALVC